MCSGKKKAAQRAQQRANQEAAKRQAEMDQLAQQRAAEQARVAEAQRQAEIQQQAEIERQAELQRQAEQARIAQEQQLARERLATEAASQSMQVLGGVGAATTAPTARSTPKPKAAGKVRATSGSQSLRIGSSAIAPGAGLNIGG